MRLAASVTACLTAVLAIGCSTPANAPLVADGGRVFASVPNAACGVGTGGSGDKFSDLYRDIFSDRGTARCQNSACHGGDEAAVNDKGAGAFPMGLTKDEAHRAITTYRCLSPQYATPGDTLPMDDAGPTAGSLLIDPKGKSFLPYLVHPLVPNPDAGPTGQGVMPRTLSSLNNCRLTADQHKRVESWVARGAPND